MKTFIIAEAGANHNRKWDLATQLIDAALEARCDAVKFQTYSSETLYSKNTPDFANYKNIPELIKSIELPREWQKDLKSYCDDSGIEFMSSPFDEKAVDELFDLGVKRLKIAGFEATDPRFVRYAASTKLPLIITAGIGVDISVMRNIVEWVLLENPNADLTFLHGNNAYPTPFSDINLGQIKEIKNADFRCDIKVGILTPPVAVALGAEVVEKHYTLDRKLEGPDHPFAIEPNELSQMVSNIRTIETALGTKDRFTQSEKNFKNACRSVVTKGKILKGETFNLDNLTTKQPMVEGAIPAIDFFDTLGTQATVDLEDDHILLHKEATKK